LNLTVRKVRKDELRPSSPDEIEAPELTLLPPSV
jgi:hypothetical protein